MKWSNFALGAVAAVSILGTGYLWNATSQSTPTAVISVPLEKGSGSAFSIKLPANITAAQAHVLQLAYRIAQADGHKYPQMLQGIVLQESKAGALDSYKVAGQEFGLKTNERYYGVSQVKLVAAKDVLSSFPNLKTKYNLQTRTDEEVIANLILNEEFNLAVASKYLLLLKTRYNVSDTNILAAWNQGPGGQYNAAGAQYSNNVKQQIRKL